MEGMTLLELLVVIAIVAVIIAVGLPSYFAIGRGSKMRNAVVGVVDEINAARGWAIAMRKSAYVVFDQYQGTYQTHIKGNVLDVYRTPQPIRLPDTTSFYSGAPTPDHQSPPAYIRCKPDGSMCNENDDRMFWFIVWQPEKDKARKIFIDGTYGRVKSNL